MVDVVVINGINGMIFAFSMDPRLLQTRAPKTFIYCMILSYIFMATTLLTGFCLGRGVPVSSSLSGIAQKIPNYDITSLFALNFICYCPRAKRSDRYTRSKAMILIQVG